MPGTFDIVLLFIIMFTGYLIKFYSNRYQNKYTLIEYHISWFTKTIYYILLPILFIIVFAERGLTLADFSITSTAVFYVVVSVLFLWTITKGYEQRFRKAFVLTATFQNTIYLGFPVVMVMYGNIEYAAMYALVTTVLHLTIGGLLGGGSNVFKTILSIPVLYGFVFGNLVHYTFYGLHLYMLPVKPFISVIVIYGSAFIMGYALPTELKYLSFYVKPVLTLSVYRITISPLIHYILMNIFGLPLEAFYQIIVESFMPPALTNIIIARIYGWDQAFVSVATLVSTFISVVIVFTLYWIGLLRIPV